MSANPAAAAPVAAAPRRQLGKILRERGILSEDQLRIALIEQKRNGEPLGKNLVKLGFVSEATLREALSENLGQSDIDVSRVVADPAALAQDFAELTPRRSRYGSRGGGIGAHGASETPGGGAARACSWAMRCSRACRSIWAGRWPANASACL